MGNDSVRLGLALAALVAAGVVACSDSSGSGGGGGAGSGGGSVTPGCTPLLNQADADTGFETCDDGTTHRRVALECPTEETSPVSPCMPAFGPPDCQSDDECTAMPLGYCADEHALTHYCGCYYGCFTDADCGDGEICECGVVVGGCVTASCTTNDDCDPGFGCVATITGSATECTNFGARSYACQTAEDECVGDAECPGTGNDLGACLMIGDHRSCGTICQLTP